MDYIEVAGIRCQARIGVPDNERQFPQELRVDVMCGFDFTEATELDEFSRTVDYERIVDVVCTTAATGSWSLVETLADALCRAILEVPRVRLAEVRVRKFPVSLRGRVEHVAAVMRRQR
ncbi:MAG: hypothetical protein Kow00109_23940 [Acidobacteriota bacterium]